MNQPDREWGPPKHSGKGNSIFWLGGSMCHVGEAQNAT